MVRKILILIGGFLTATWGIAHLFPTKNVVKGFGEISVDNTRIITMEWMNEGFTLIFIGLLVIAVALIGGMNSKVSKSVWLLSFIMLETMSVLSLFTGFKIDFLPYQLCPVIFTVSGLLILQGVFIKNSEQNPQRFND
jgi:hypothetical protein